MHDGVTARFIEPGTKEPAEKLPDDLIDATLQARIMQDVFDNLQRPQRQPEVSEELATHFFTINGLDQQAIHKAATLLTSTQGLGDRFAQRNARTAATRTMRDAHQRVQGLVQFLKGLDVRDATTHDSQMALNLGTIEGRFSKLGLIDVTEPKMNAHGCHAVVPVVPLSAVPAMEYETIPRQALPPAPSHIDTTLSPPAQLADLSFPPMPGKEPVDPAAAAFDALPQTTPPVSAIAALAQTARAESFVAQAQAEKVYLLACADVMAAKALLSPHTGNNQVFSLLHELANLCDSVDLGEVAYATRTLLSSQKHGQAGEYTQLKRERAETQIASMEQRVKTFLEHYDAWAATIDDPTLLAQAHGLEQRLHSGLEASLTRAGVTYDEDGKRTLVRPDIALGIHR